MRDRDSLHLGLFTSPKSSSARYVDGNDSRTRLFELHFVQTVERKGTSALFERVGGKSLFLAHYRRGGEGKRVVY